MTNPEPEKKLYEQLQAANEPSLAPKIFLNTNSRYVVKPHQYQPGGWLSAPAIFEFFKATDAALVAIAAQRGMTLNQVAKLRLARVEGEKRIYILPTHEQDEDGLEIRRFASKLSVNMIGFLAPAKLCVDPGHKERYELLEAGPDSPVGPALYFDMTKPAERTTIRRSKRDHSPPNLPPASAT